MNELNQKDFGETVMPLGIIPLLESLYPYNNRAIDLLFPFCHQPKYSIAPDSYNNRTVDLLFPFLLFPSINS